MEDVIFEFGSAVGAGVTGANTGLPTPGRKKKKRNLETEEEGSGEAWGKEEDTKVGEEERGDEKREEVEEETEEGEVGEDGQEKRSEKEEEAAAKAAEEEEARNQVREDVRLSVAMTSWNKLQDVENRLGALFVQEKDNVNYNDGFLVGGFICQWAPSFELVAAALRKVGVKDSEMCPVTNSSTLQGMAEVRVASASMVEPVGKIIRRSGAKIAELMKRSFKWRDLRWADFWVISMKGIPIGWWQEEVRAALKACGFPTNGLVSMGRPTTDKNLVRGGGS
jgi:hypothetical protein